MLFIVALVVGVAGFTNGHPVAAAIVVAACMVPVAVAAWRGGSVD